jgi:hypothetical protein
MRSVSILILLANASVSAEPDAARLRAKAALALAFAPPTYAEQYAKAIQEKKPLVVFVGQPAKPVGNCVCVACDAFPDATPAGVVIGLPDGAGLRRVDLPGEPTAERIREALAGLRSDRGSTSLPARQ